MKKPLIIAVLTIIFTTFLNAQTKLEAEKQVERFNVFYEKNQPDSIFNLFSTDVKNALKLSTTAQMINQLRSQFGKIISHKAIGSQQGISAFKELFEKAGYALFLNFDKENKIAGIFVRPEETAETDQTAASDNFLLRMKDSDIAGTFEVPDSKLPVPLVLIIAGSGPTDRNGNSGLGLRTNSYQMLAEKLKQSGIASLRYDKRGIGKSRTSKAYSETVFDDFVLDAVDIIKQLKSDKRFSKIVVAGHSEGALVGMLACNREATAGYISISGAGFPIDSILRTQLAANSTDLLQSSSKIIDSLKAGLKVRQELPASLMPIFNSSVQPFLISWMKLNPTSEFQKMKTPSLIIQGTTDLQVEEKNALLLSQANKKASLKIIQHMNHVLKKAPAERTQNLQTYNSPDLALHPDLVPAIVEFVKGLR